ncbi:hypothetical protein [Streptomyces sirii]|uniref:hypothetical protein n=1 Tax=Streptomyces sirii TaxID=3127701 RepID=UPI003D362221
MDNGTTSAHDVKRYLGQSAVTDCVRASGMCRLNPHPGWRSVRYVPQQPENLRVLEGVAEGIDV